MPLRTWSISPILGGRNNYQTTATVGKRLGQQKFGALIGFSYDYEAAASWRWTSADSWSLEALRRRYFDSIDSRIQVLPHAVGVAKHRLPVGPRSTSTCAMFSDSTFWDRWVYSLNDNSASISEWCGGHHPSIIHSQASLYHWEPGVGRKARLQ